MLALPYNKVKVIQVATGGGFGGKEDVPSQVCGLASILAYKAKKPVKLILNREEDFSPELQIAGYIAKDHCRAYTLDGLFLGVLRFNPESAQWQPKKVFG